MGSKHLVEILRDDPGHYAPEELNRLWGQMPERYRTTDLDSHGLLDTDMVVFSMSAASRSFRIQFAVLGEPMDRELAWCCFHIIELGGRVHHAPPAAARRAARRPAALRADRSGFPRQDSSQAAGRGTR